MGNQCSDMKSKHQEGWISRTGDVSDCVYVCILPMFMHIHLCVHGHNACMCAHVFMCVCVCECMCAFTMHACTHIRVCMCVFQESKALSIFDHVI